MRDLTQPTMVTREDLESFLDRLTAGGATIKEVEPGLWSVRPGGALELDVIVHYNPPVVLLRVKVMDLPGDEAQANAVARRLLELNATDLLHGSYGISGSTIILTEALELGHLDYEEFLAAYESMTLALASHMRELSTFQEAR
ncbi:MAG: hypothetical protein HY275_16810 [Gemmatimonadetes bacterium]|nr:hypothetical protein [Gemmatimonadota bacterium]